MKTSTMGIVSAAILMVVAGVGFGIAQAAGNQSYDPTLKFGDQDVNPYIDMDAWQAREALETGSLPAGSDADSSKVATEEDVYQGWRGITEWGNNE